MHKTYTTPQIEIIYINIEDAVLLGSEDLYNDSTEDFGGGLNLEF